MPRAFMKLPPGLAGAAGVPRLDCEGATVREALEDCVAKEPRLRTKVFRDDGTVWVGVFLNGRNVRLTGGLDAPLAEGDEIRIVPPIGGG